MPKTNSKVKNALKDPQIIKQFDALDKSKAAEKNDHA